ncbi:SUMF1/EgtB/PvdO family nonheme iron enzyme [Desulfobacterales bacterium HSG16]|nr:SUMF1/EgtB/PvdO family nonheme iron enzyme [Desulfobacterales bacterium HSG16]
MKKHEIDKKKCLTLAWRKQAVIFLFLPVLFLLSATPCPAFSGGDIQITCEQGVRIWLDNAFKGKTLADENGMFIENLKSGTYKIKAIKSGYKPEIKIAKVRRGKTIEVRFRFTTPAMKVENLTEGGRAYSSAGYGTLILRSLPLRAEVFLDGEKIGTTDTKVSHVAARKHRIKFVFKGKVLEKNYNLGANQVLKLKAHFKKNRIMEERDTKFGNTLDMKFVYIVPRYSGKTGSVNRQSIPGPFYLQTTEVTQGQWKRVMKKNPSTFKKCGDKCPVESVSFSDVKSFIDKLNQREGTDRYRLPTQAEWEYACRAGQNSARFCFGNKEKELGSYAWYSKNSRNKTHRVAKKKVSSWGLYDMHGNISEWCSDLYDGMTPVCQGGDFADPAKMLSCQVKEIPADGSGSSSIGFRLVRMP